MSVSGAERQRLYRQRHPEYERGRSSLRGDHAPLHNAARPITTGNPKRAAWGAVADAVKDGRLLREPCEVCGATDDVHAHHNDYARRLEVSWLCRTHHADHHKTHGEALNAI